MVLFISAIGLIIPTYIGSGMVNLIWFHLGYLICSKKLDTNKKWIVCLSMASILSVTLYFLLPIIVNNKYLLYVPKYIASSSIILLAYKIIPNYKNVIINTLSEYSFGIYLFHSPLIYLSFNFFPEIAPVLMLIVNFGLLAPLSGLITLGISKTKLKFILGG
jgi:peptidoglycan/LPS O-acetylase OafA/YrhL